jgi:hypothetical protein
VLRLGPTPRFTARDPRFEALMAKLKVDLDRRRAAYVD